MCDILPETFDLNGFLLFSAIGNLKQRQYPAWGRMAGLSSFLLRAVLSGHLSVATTHTGHDRFIASCGAIPSQILPPLFTELRTSRMTLRAHVGVSEFLLPVAPGQAGSAPAESSIEFRFLAKSALFYCVFLRRLSRNKAREGHAANSLAGNGIRFVDENAAESLVGDGDRGDLAEIGRAHV